MYLYITAFNINGLNIGVGDTFDPSQPLNTDDFTLCVRSGNIYIAFSTALEYHYHFNTCNTQDVCEAHALFIHVLKCDLEAVLVKPSMNNTKSVINSNIC